MYFRTKAEELGCPNVDQLGDNDVWLFIMAKQGS